jgi:hypothetical protein
VIRWLTSLATKLRRRFISSQTSSQSSDSRWCLVANVSERYEKAQHPQEFKKRFSAGRKVYVNSPHWGDGWERTQIFVQDHRNAHWYVQVFRVEWLHNFRAVLEYSPTMRVRLDEHSFLGGYTDKDKKRCEDFAKEGNGRLEAYQLQDKQKEGY